MTRHRRMLMVLALVLGLGIPMHLALVDFYLNRVYAGGVAERTQAEYDELRATIRTLIVGHSHAKWGIAAAELDDAFNLALDGQTVPESYYLLRHELDDPAVDLEAVILPADSVSFSYWRRRGIGFKHFYAPRVDYLAIGRARGELLRYGSAGFLGRYAPYAGMRSDILHYLETDTAPQLAAHVGHELVRGSYLARNSFANVPEAEREQAVRTRMLFHFPRVGFDEVAGDYFRRTLELARDRGVTAVVVRFPLTKEYLLASRPWMEGARLNERVDAILADHPEAIVVDARFDFAERLGLFVDPDHLNGKGSLRLTRRLRRLLASLAS